MSLYTAILPEIQAMTADRQGSPSTPWTGNYCKIQGSNGWDYRTFLQYDLSSIPKGAPIVSAKLKVYCSYWNDNGGSGTTNISRVTKEWDDATLTWNNQPTTTGTYLSTNVKAPAVGTWSDWDITNLVQEWVSDTYPNYGLYVKNNNEGSYRVDWNMSCYKTGDGNASYIEVVYDWTYTSHFYYNGVLLPKLPENQVDGFIQYIIDEYPYCWIRKDLTNECYDLIFSKSPFYLNSDGTAITADSEDILCYRLEMATLDSAEEWVQCDNDSIEFELNSDRTVLWSNHSILSDSATSETVYVHKSYMIHLVSDDITELNYGETTLPKLPSDVLTEYPYCWISKADRLFASAHPWHYVSAYMMISELAVTKVYKLSESKSEWILEKSDTNLGEYNLLNLPKWSSHDIPNDSYESTDIYFYGSDAEPGTSNSGGPDSIPGSDSKIYTHTIDFGEEGWTTLRPDVYTITDGNVPFYVNSTFTYDGKPTLRSGNISHYGTSETTINFTLIADGSIEFAYIVSSEGADPFYVYIDGTQVVQVSGTGHNWTTYTKSLTAGNHTIRFRYYKDRSVNTGSDAGAIGYITFTGVNKDFDKLYLVRYDNKLYSIVDGVLSPIDATELTSVVFLECGFYDCPTWEQISNLTDPEILYWFDSDKYIPIVNANMEATPFSQTIVSNKIDLTHATITGIEEAIVTCEGNPLFCVSFDNKQTWKAWNGTEWATVSEANSGMTKELFESIDYDNWLLLYEGADSFYIKVILDSSEISQSVTQIYVDFAN